MDLEEAVIRAEMTQTRQALDTKIDRLEERVRELAPQRVWERNKPDFLADRALGGALTFLGLMMAWSQFRRARRHRSRSREIGPEFSGWGSR